MKQLPYYSRGYLKPRPTPKVPEGLEELMEGLSREVLRHNPSDIYKFCADHMKKLLDIRDAHLKTSKKPKTLEDKIKNVQNIMKLKFVERIQNDDKQMNKQLADGAFTYSDSSKSNSQSFEKITKDANYSTKKIENENTVNHNAGTIAHIPVIADNLDEVVIKSQSTIESPKNNIEIENITVEETAQVESIEHVNEDIKKRDVDNIDTAPAVSDKDEAKKQYTTGNTSTGKPVTENRDIDVHEMNKDDKITGDTIIPIQEIPEDSSYVNMQISSTKNKEVKAEDLELIKINDLNNTNTVSASQVISEDLKEVATNIVNDVKTFEVSVQLSSTENKEINEPVQTNDHEIKTNNINNVSATQVIFEDLKEVTNNAEQVSIIENKAINEYVQVNDFEEINNKSNAKPFGLTELISKNSKGVTTKHVIDVKSSDVDEKFSSTNKKEMKDDLDILTDDKNNAKPLTEGVSEDSTKHLSDVNTSGVTEQATINIVTNVTNDTVLVNSTVIENQDNKEFLQVNDIINKEDKNSLDTVNPTLAIANSLKEDSKLHLGSENMARDPEKARDTNVNKDSTQNNDDKVNESLNSEIEINAAIMRENTQHEVAEVVITEDSAPELKVSNGIKETNNKINQVDKTAEDLKEQKNVVKVDIVDRIDHSGVSTNKTDIAPESKDFVLIDKSILEKTSSQDKAYIDKISDNKNKVDSAEIMHNDIKENTAHYSKVNNDKDLSTISAVRKEIIEGEPKDDNTGSESPVCIADVIHAPDSAVPASINEIKTINSIEYDETQNSEEKPKKIGQDDINIDNNRAPNDTSDNIKVSDDKMSAEVFKESSMAPKITSENIKVVTVDTDSEINNDTKELTLNDASDNVLINTPTLLTAKSVESDIITGNVTTDTELTTEKNSSTEDNTNDLSSESNAEELLSDSNVSKLQTPMDLETAAITIQKVFRTFMFRSRTSTLEDVPNYEGSIDIPYTTIDNAEDEIETKDNEVEYTVSTASKERRTLGISRMDTVLQTVNEEKSLSLSTDDSSTLSSAATTIQAHVRGYLVRNRLTSNKTNSNSSLVNSDVEIENQKNKTVLNIHIVPEGGHFISRDESIGTSIDLPFDVSPRTTNLHSLGSDISERRKQLKREDAIQSVSPPSNNSGKLSEDFDSVKDFPITHNETVTEVGIISENYQEDDGYVTNKELEFASHETTPTKSTTADTVIEVSKIIDEDKIITDVEGRRKRLTKMSSDEMDVVTPTSSTSPTKLMHSGEFHDVVLPTRVSRNASSVVREFKSVLVYFLLWNK